MKAAPAKLDSEAKQRIFAAATQEFAKHGIAGARTDTIARAANVNIALLFYYFKNKQQLHDAVLDEVFSSCCNVLRPALERDGTASERVLRYVEAFFDFVAQSPWRPRLVQQELRSDSPYVLKLLRKHVKPVQQKLHGVIKAGVEAGEFREVDITNFIQSISPLITHYFSASTAIEELTGADPLSPAKVKARKAAVLDFVSAALFAHPTKGTRKQ
jgi:TetR/AcrR family transcriptional regulator